MSQLSFKIKELLGLISNCSIRNKYSIYCPGCGGTRALLALIDGKILTSLYYNPLVICIIFDIVFSIITVYIEKFSYNKSRFMQYRITIKIINLIVILLLFVVRNILLIYFDVDLLGDFST